MTDPKKDSIVEEIPESPEVILNDKVFVVNELTARQDTALAKLFKGAEFIDIITGASKVPLKVPEDEEEILRKHAQAQESALVQALLTELAADKLVKFLSIVLVPKDTLVYREKIADEYKEYFGDLKNTEIHGVVKHFFTLNVQSLQSTVVSLTTPTQLNPKSDQESKN